MIVRDRPNGLRLFLTMRGSVLPTASCGNIKSS